MKIFLSILSLLFGIMLGAAITVFLVIKRNPFIQANLCKNFSQTENALEENHLKGLLDTSFLKDNITNIIKNSMDGSSSISTTTASVNKSSDNSQLPAVGPGGCKTEDECLAYCSNLENLKECLNFAKKYMGDVQ